MIMFAKGIHAAVRNQFNTKAIEVPYAALVTAREEKIEVLDFLRAVGYDPVKPVPVIIPVPWCVGEVEKEHSTFSSCLVSKGEIIGESVMWEGVRWSRGWYGLDCNWNWKSVLGGTGNYSALTGIDYRCEDFRGGFITLAW